MICHGRGRGLEATPLAGGRNPILGTEFIVWVGLRQTSMKTETQWALPWSSPVTASHKLPSAKRGVIPVIPLFVEIGSPGKNLLTTGEARDFRKIA